jgi:hypothetical protein
MTDPTPDDLARDLRADAATCIAAAEIAPCDERESGWCRIHDAPRHTPYGRCLVGAILEPAASGWPVAIRRALAAEAERDKLQAFKTWVHQFLDGRGVPADPDPEGTREHGCRIGGRMRWVFAEVARLRAVVQSLAERTAAQSDILTRHAEKPPAPADAWDTAERVGGEGPG